MKETLLLLFCWLTLTARAQVVVDASVIKDYNTVVKKMKPEYQKGLKELQTGFAIFIVYDKYTINKKEAPDLSNIHVSSVGANKTDDETKQADTYLPIPCAAILKSNALTIAIPPAFNPYLKHQIVGKQIVSTYEEYQKGDDIFRLKLTDSKKQQLSVPVKTTSFKLNTSHYKPGQVLYGEVSFETEPYYIDDSLFKSGYLYTKLRGVYVFKAVIIDARHPAGL